MSASSSGIIYRQYDNAWANDPYPYGGDNMANSGCGPTSIANILANSIKPNITPHDTGVYMNSKGYAIANCGSTWAGITETLKHFGVESTFAAGPSASKVFELMNGYKYSILLFGAGTQGGVTWTAGGHFVAATDYKVEGGKHWFFTRDSGGRKNDGWHCFEDTMSNLLACIYVCTSLQGGNSGSITTEEIERAASSVLSSNNYTYINWDKEANDTKSSPNKITELFKTALQTLNPPYTEQSALEVIEKTEHSKSSALAVLDSILGNITAIAAKAVNKSREKTAGTLLSYPTVVQAPTIVLNLNGVIIGGYGNFGDVYPNYITSMTVDKTSGKINRYRINLTYQVRFGEDPNFIDKLLSRTGFTNKIQILYGDSNGLKMFRDDEALITDVTFNESVSSKTINYTITAVSSIISASSIKGNYSSKTDKPSNLIHDLFYSVSDTSRALLSALPGMSNTTLVNSSGLIPTNDEIVTTQPMIGASPITMLNYYVSGMYNTDTNSIYTLTYHDDITNDFGGPYVKITEIGSTDTSALAGNYFEVDVGYPGENFVTDFSIDNSVYFPLVYKYNQNLPKWVYDIDNDGNIFKTQTNSLISNNKFDRPNVVAKEWWKRVTEYPVTASLTVKGLLKPILLGSYIRVNVLFYGNEDLASGLYAVTGQTDTISGNGYFTTLSLLRVGS